MWDMQIVAMTEALLYLEYIYSLYYMASLLTFINPLLLNGDSLGTSVIFGTHLNRIADSNINLS